MSAFISALNKNQLCKAFVEHYELDSYESIEEAYRAALKLNNVGSKRISTPVELKNFYANFAVAPGELRFSLPFTFDIKNKRDLFWIKQPGHFSWKSLNTKIKSVQPKTAMLLAPVAWQLGPLFFQECDTNHIVATAFDAANANSAELLLKNHPIEMLVTTSESLKILIEMNSKIPRSVLVVETFGKVPYLLTPDDTTVTYDIHLSPGIPIAVAEMPYQSGTFNFKPSEDYLYFIDKDKTYVSALNNNAQPLFHYELPAATAVTDSAASHLAYVT